MGTTDRQKKLRKYGLLAAMSLAIAVGVIGILNKTMDLDTTTGSVIEASVYVIGVLFATYFGAYLPQKK